ncbi:MAG: Ig-like domain repeat protein [Aeromicrobium sp.]
MTIRTAVTAMAVTLAAALTMTLMPGSATAAVTPAPEPTTVTTDVPPQVAEGEDVVAPPAPTDTAPTDPAPTDTAPTDTAPPQSSAAEVAAPTTTTIAAPAQFTLRRPVTVSAHVAGTGETGATGTIRFEQQTAAGWTVLSDVAVDAAGNAALTTTFATTPVTLRATYLGAEGHDPSTSAPTTLTGVPQPASVRLNAPRSIVDERTLKLSAKVTTPYASVPGATVSFQVFRDRKWRTYASARTDGAGVARVRSQPRTTYRYRAVVTGADWYTGAKSATRKVKNTPPGKVITLPKKAPRPTKLPAQPRASGSGANATTSTLSSSVWSSMPGRSWRAGCPVGRADLRIVRVNYWGFDGYRHRGEIVVHRSIAGKTARLFTDLHKNKVSIRAMYRVDRFGYSATLRGANDYASMARDNTSGFNCRNVVGRPGVRSPHAYGRAIDINPFENPYRAGRWIPNSWWHTRAVGTYAWTRSSHLVPRIMKRNGFRWTYGNLDAHHFDG